MKKILFLSLLLAVVCNAEPQITPTMQTTPTSPSTTPMPSNQTSQSQPKSVSVIQHTSSSADASVVTASENSSESKTPLVNNAEAIEINESLKIVPITQHQEDQQLRYTIDLNYPQIEGENLSVSAQQFNKLIMQKVEQEVEQFKKYVTADMPHMQSLPEDLKHNSLRVDYDVDVVRPNDTILISIRLSNEGFQAGRAHPYHNHKVINFDFTRGKSITLAELFKPKSAYLRAIAKYANKKLVAKLDDKWMINEGTKPIEKNYQVWNLENDGVLLTFDEYQVAPYVYGAQEVEIPYSELKSILSPNAPIYICAVSPSNCNGAN